MKQRQPKALQKQNILIPGEGRHADKNKPEAHCVWIFSSTKQAPGRNEEISGYPSGERPVPDSIQDPAQWISHKITDRIQATGYAVSVFPAGTGKPLGKDAPYTITTKKGPITVYGL